MDRSSRPEVFLEKDALKICSRFTGEHPCRSVISVKLLCTGKYVYTRLKVPRSTFLGECFYIEIVASGVSVLTVLCFCCSLCKVQKQPCRSALEKRCSGNMQ